MYEPIVIWPSGTYVDCSSYGNYYDCTWTSGHDDLAAQGALICCPIW